MSPVPASRRLLVAFFFVMVAALGAWGGNVTLKATTPLAETTASPTPTLGQIESDGTLDTTFDAGHFTNGDVVTSVLQPDGKLLIAGYFSKVHGVTRIGIARLNADGTLDGSFDAGSAVDPLVGSVNRMVLQPDGKILILFPLQRLNSDGSADSTFHIADALSLTEIGAPNPHPGYAVDVLLQADGKIIVVGHFYYILTGPDSDVARSCIARFNSDGTFDPSFDPGSGFSGSTNSDVYGFPDNIASHVVQQSVGANSGKVVVQGSFTRLDGHLVRGLARLNPDGSYDASFTPSSNLPDPIADSSFYSGLLALPDDRLILHGTNVYSDGTYFTGVARFESSGAYDPTFQPPAFRDYDNYYGAQISAVAVQADGQLLVGGSFHLVDGEPVNNVARLQTDGSRDRSFAALAAGPSAYHVDTLCVRPGDGHIFVGGYFSSYDGVFRNNLAWLNTDGSVDDTFAGLAGVADQGPIIYAILAQPDGKILVGGFFSSLNGVSRYNLVRLNPDSSIDPSFNPNFGSDGSIRTMLLQPDGKILIGGALNSVDGVGRAHVARLNADGTLDLSFDPGTGSDGFNVSGIIYGLAQDAEGNTYVGGDFTYFNGISRPGIVKLTPTGAVDSTFDPDYQAVGGITYSLAPPDDNGGIVIGEQTVGDLRLDTTTGGRDYQFKQPFSGYFNIYSILRTNDEKYYVAGDGQYVTRLNSDGSIDTSFSRQVYGRYLALQNGKVFVASGYIPTLLRRLTETGAIDPSFNDGSGFAISPSDAFYNTFASLNALAVQPDGKLLVGGSFNEYNGVNRVGLVRLTGPVVTPTPTPTATPTPTVTPTPTPSVSPTPTASPSITPTPSPSASPSPSPTLAPVALGNISTRLRVETGENVLIGGFIVTGTDPKKVIVRAIGPSLAFNDALADPVLELHASSGALIATNDNWRSDQEVAIKASKVAPENNLESAIVATLPAGGAEYTAIVRGKNGGAGIGLVEVYDLDPAGNSRLANISTRGLVQSGDNILIAGTIVLGDNPQKVLIRAIGPSLPVADKLGDPTLELRDENGALLDANDDWRSDQEAEIKATKVAPTNDRESALIAILPAHGAGYTAIVRGANETAGVALVEIYSLQ